MTEHKKCRSQTQFVVCLWFCSQCVWICRDSNSCYRHFHWERTDSLQLILFTNFEKNPVEIPYWWIQMEGVYKIRCDTRYRKRTLTHLLVG